MGEPFSLFVSNQDFGFLSMPKARDLAVLHIPPIDSPEKAVRAAIVHDQKAGKLK
jgi:hypothetical protein